MGAPAKSVYVYMDESLMKRLQATERNTGQFVLLLRCNYKHELFKQDASHE